MPAFEKRILHFLKRDFCSSIIKTKTYKARGGGGDEIRKVARMRGLYRTVGAAAGGFEMGSQ